MAKLLHSSCFKCLKRLRVKQTVVLMETFRMPEVSSAPEPQFLRPHSHVHPNAHRHIFSKKSSKVIYAHTRTHISENFPALIFTKIAAPAHVHTPKHSRTLKICSYVLSQDNK